MRQFAAALLVVGDHLGHVIGDEIHMLHGQHRQFDADHAADLARPQAARIHHVFGD